MPLSYTFNEFKKKYHSDDLCLEEIVSIRYPNGMHCKVCNRTTKHYKLKNRMSYTCKLCRTQISPLTGTIFEKSTTPLHIWFDALYIMTQSKADITIKEFQTELGVTYKTAWRMYTLLHKLMRQNNGDLLRNISSNDEQKIHKWVFFNKIEIKLVQK